MKRLNVRELIILIVLIGVLIAAILIHGDSTEPIDSFAECANAGYIVTDSNPPVCIMGSRNFNGPVASPSPSSEPIVSQITELLVDGNSEGTYPRGWQVIHTQAEWTAFWSAIHRSVALPPLIPVDFATSDVVALSEGVEPTPGYGVEITDISSTSHGTIVRIRETHPVNCVEPQHTTNPYYIVRTAKLVDPVSFTVESSAHSCS